MPTLEALQTSAPRRTTSPELIVKRSLLAFCWCSVTLTVLAWGISLFCSLYLHKVFPFNTQLFNPIVRFSDLTDYYARMRNLSAGGGILNAGTPQFNYPAPAVYVFAFFICLFRQPVVALLGFTAGAALSALLILRRRLTGVGTDSRQIDVMLAVTALCSYPFQFLIDRGNLEGVVWFFAFLGLVLFARGRYLISALLFAAAVCIKPFPALFFFLFPRATPL